LKEIKALDERIGKEGGVGEKKIRIVMSQQIII
jgi:hypothetical protein